MLYRVAPEIAIACAKGHFFAPDTMKFHKTRISDTCYDVEGFYLMVISNKYPGESRHYRIIQIDKGTGRVSYAFEEHFNTLAKVKQRAAWWAEPLTPFFVHKSSGNESIHA